MARPRVVTSSVASVDGRVTVALGVLLLHGDDRWSSIPGGLAGGLPRDPVHPSGRASTSRPGTASSSASWRTDLRTTPRSAALTRTSAEPAFRKTFKDRKGIDFVKMDAQEMTFADASFDTVCIANSLHHVADLRRVLAEMARVLRPKGRFIVAEMYCDGQTDPQMTHVLLHHWWAQPR